jgi:hypothetical protein
MRDEPVIIINGTRLTDAESETLRVAIDTLLYAKTGHLGTAN